MKILFVQLFKINLKIIYCFMKFIKTKNNKITFLSRQSNKIPHDFVLIIDELKKEKINIEVKVLSRKMGSSLLDKLKYYFHLYSQMYHIATSKVCVIDSYIIPISILKHKKSLVVIQTWHAMGAIKKFGYQTLDRKGGSSSKLSKAMKMHCNYDYIIAGSNAMIKCYSESFNAPYEKILPYGLPRIDYLQTNYKKIRSNILKKYKNINNKKIILYVPTFRKGKDNYLCDLINTIDLEKYNLIIKNHPNKKIKINDDRIYVCKEFSSLQLLTIADYIITDYSAISIEAAILNKPIYFYLYDYEEYVSDTGVNINLFEEMKSSTFVKFKDLYKALNKCKYNFEELKLFRDKYITNQSGNSTKKIVDLIVKRGLNYEEESEKSII